MKKHLHRIHKTLTAPEYLKILALRTIGNFLILTSLFLIVKTLAKPVYEEVRYGFDQWRGKQYIVVSPQTQPEAIAKLEREFTTPGPKGLLSGLISGRNVEVLIPKDPNFSVVIPAIGANANVVADVNPADESAYLDALKYGVAHAAGTAHPGEGGHIYLFAHSTDYVWNVGLYNAIFYLLYKLNVNDEINLFYQGQRFRYQVQETKIVNPDEVSYLTRETDGELLTLQTCWPPGTTLQRLLVFARRVVQ